MINPMLATTKLQRLLWVAEFLLILGAGTVLAVPIVFAQETPTSEGAAEPEGSAEEVGDGSGSEEPTGPTAEVAARAELLKSFNMELHSTEQEVNHYKERTHRAKATLQLLRELVIDNSAMGSRLLIWHINKLGGGYEMTSMKYFLDGNEIYARARGVGTAREVKVYEATQPEGGHFVQVEMRLEGRGFGIFSYLRSYGFNVSSKYYFDMPEGFLTIVKVITNERSGFARTFVDRPYVTYDQKAWPMRHDSEQESDDNPWDK